MKILAIRGRNLASLAGDFELDLQAEPLGSAGLFAITGPTGSGKTTLLDALSLALFDRTPRLAGRSAVHVGRADGERLGAADPRSLLTRGTGAGHAEVDFVGVDGVVYTARWSVHRARKRPEGSLQDARLTLTQRDSGAVVAGGAVGSRRQTRAEISARLGLDFEQFRRSALLAQGDFAAFLRAQPRDRSELLERITGSDVYARLSVAAHDRCRQEQAHVQIIDQQLEGLGVLAEAERVTLEARLDDAAAEREVATSVLQQVEEAVQWFAELERREAEVTAGRERVLRAEQAVEAAAPRRRALAVAERAERLRARWERWNRAARTQADALQAAATAQAAAVAATTEAAQRAAAAEEAAEIARRAHRRLDEADPVLSDARRADQRCAAARAVLDTAGGEERRTRQAADEAGAAVAALRARVREVQLSVSSARVWRQRHGWLESLAASWGHVSAELEQLQRTRGVLADQRRDEQAGVERVGALEQRLAGVRRSVEDLRRELSECEAAVAAAEQAELEASHADVAAERRRAAADRAVALEALAAARSARRYAGERVAAQDALAAAKAAGESAAQARVHGGDALARAELLLSEARRAWERARDAFSEADRRSRLEAGKPCPLCGSPEHPWADGSPFDEGLAAFEARVRQLEQAVDDGRSATLKAASEASGAEERARVASQDLDKASAGLQEARARWRDLRASSGDALPQDVEHDGAAEAAQRACEAADRRLAEADRVDEEQRRLTSAASAARRAREAARTAADSAQREQASLQSELEPARRALAELAAAARATGEREAELSRSLSSLLAAVPEARPGLADAPRLAERLGADVARWRAEGERLDRAAEEQRVLQAQLAVAEGDAERTAEAAHAAHLHHEQAQRAFGRAMDERARLLDGAEADAVERELRDAVRAADAARHASREALAEADVAAESAETLRRERQLRSAAAVTETAEARAALEAGLAAEAVDEETVAAQCALDAGWVDAERAALHELGRQVDEARAVLAERMERLASHRATRASELSRDEVEVQLGLARERLERAEHTHRDLAISRRRDEEAQARSAELAKERGQAAAASRVWEQLDALIGSASGESFRSFAQSLTLEALLVEANAHLGQLSPRYRLQRVPGADLALQVIDRDFGDEVRSVNSLSGGETFLASLALALGLASLSAVDTPVESLFIDEGLGTLDPETLDVALSALDALQASGRQIGIISHVESLSEHVAANVRVIKRGSGRSRLQVRAVVVP